MSFTIRDNSNEVIRISSNVTPHTITFCNPDGSKINLGPNDSKVIKVTTIDGKINFELITDSK